MDVFYEKDVINGVHRLGETESHHCSVVLRHAPGDLIQVIDGKGNEFTAKLTSTKKICEFDIIEERTFDPKSFRTHLAISPTKNIDRMEWMVEKLGELSVDEITFLKTKNGERSRLRLDRLEKKAIAAMKQSGSRFLTKVNELKDFRTFISQGHQSEKWMAHLGTHTEYLGSKASPGTDSLILIGPEGDFDSSEIELAESAGYLPVSLGKTTLRTETAGLMACHILNVLNCY